MKIVIAPDKFKGSLNSLEVCNIVKKGLIKASSSFEIIKLPMSDGGDGLSEVVAQYTNATWQICEVQDPLGKIISAQWLLSADGKTAFIEMAKASGLQLLKQDQYNPLITSTFGTGQLIRAAIAKNVQTIILGIGGSATNDGGMGMASALGYRFIGKDGTELLPIGENLLHVKSIESSNKIVRDRIKFKVACDVKNLLYGEQGATKIYAPQKGADNQMVEQLENGMYNFAAVLKKDVGIDVSLIEGGGAAGGLGAGCIAFLHANLVEGIDLVMQLASMEKYISSTDIVITGEGKIDGQSLQGKVVSGVARLTKKYNKRLFAVCGSSTVDSFQLKTLGIEKTFSILNDEISLYDAIEHAATYLEDLSFTIGKVIENENNSIHV